MANVSLDDRAFYRSEYEKAEQQFRLVNNKLSGKAVSELARGVVKRLAFRMPNSVKRDDLPSHNEIAALCEALLSKVDHAADDFILSARRESANIEVIYLSNVAGAARCLGQLWYEDQISFMDVTFACGKLYRIIRELRHVIAPSIIKDRVEYPVMFALVPGDTHTLGIEITTDIFRREGRDVNMIVGLDHDMLVDLSDRRNYRAIVLVANSDTMIEPLTSIVLCCAFPTRCRTWSWRATSWAIISILAHWSALMQ